MIRRFRKLKSDEALESIKILVSDATSKVSVEISKELRNMTEEHSVKGSLRSGIFVSATLTMIDRKITESCRNTLAAIEGLQDKWNNPYTVSTLESISELVKHRYLGLIDSAIRDWFETVEIANPLNRTNDTHINSLKQRIPGMVNSKVKEIELHNNVKKDPPGVKEARKANRIAIVAIIVALISLIVSLKK